MKHRKLISVLIVACICISCIFFNGTFATTTPEYTISDLSAMAVTPDESEFTYICLPKNNPTYAVVQKYTGEDISIAIPETLGGYPVQRVLGSAFNENDTIQYYRLPEGVKFFETNSMQGCTSLKAIDVAEANDKFVSVDGILYSKDMTTLVAYPRGLKGAFTIPDSVTAIGRNAFSYCTYLTSVSMGNSVESVGDYAFSGSYEMDSIRLSDNITFIGSYAFFKCGDLSKIEIPYSVIYIGENAFLGEFSSDNHLVYYVRDGIYYTPGTYAEEYVKNLHLPLENLHQIDRRFTDPESGVSIIDPYLTLPKNKKLELKVDILPNEDYSSLIGIRYDNLFCYDISLSDSDGELSLSKDIIIEFTGLGEGNIPSATKLFRYTNGTAPELVRSPHTPFAGIYTKELGAFIVATNSDFSLEGDIDGNGIITTYDARFALCIAADMVTSLTPEQSATADFDKNGAIDTDDAIKILRRAAGII